MDPLSSQQWWSDGNRIHLMNESDVYLVYRMEYSRLFNFDVPIFPHCYSICALIPPRNIKSFILSIHWIIPYSLPCYSLQKNCNMIYFLLLLKANILDYWREIRKNKKYHSPLFSHSQYHRIDHSFRFLVLPHNKTIWIFPFHLLSIIFLVLEKSSQVHLHLPLHE